MAAERGGADRVELCAALVEGGTTPSLGAIREARARTRLRIMVMIRPRAGDFLYSDVDLAVMERDIRAAKEIGVDGVVFGLLDPDGDVDVPRTGRLVEIARPLEVTFHRAFDHTRDPVLALEKLIAAGVTRVLTSGQERTAAEGAALLARLVGLAGSRIAVMPGGGIREHNVREIVERTGAREVHLSAGGAEPSAMIFKNSRCSLGAASGLSEDERRITDVALVRRVVDALSAPSLPSTGGHR